MRALVRESSAQLTIELSQQRAQLEEYKAYPYGKIRSDITQANDIYTCAFNYIHFHVVDSETASFNSTYVFEKTTIPLTLHVSREKDDFHITLKTLNGFIDHETADQVLAYIQHDLTAIIEDLAFSWMSEAHPKLFHEWHKTTMRYPENQPQQLQNETQKPRNALEKALCETWQSVLGIPSVGITDSFFELGGDSIRSIRLVARMQENGFYVSVGDIFKYKTILQLIEKTNHRLQVVQESYLPFSLIDDATRINVFCENEIGAIEDIYPAAHLQMSMLIKSLEIDANGTYHDVFSYAIHRAFNAELLLTLLKSLSQKYPLLRTAFMEHTEYGYISVQHSELDIVSHYGGVIEEDVVNFIQAEKNRVFSINEVGLFRVYILNPMDNQFVFIFSFHHAIADGWSVASLMSELTEAYASEKAIMMETIPPYQRVIQQERLALVSNAHALFWRDYLADAPLPMSHFIMHPAKLTGEFELACVLENEKAVRILSTAKQLGVTPDVVFLAAYFKTVSRFFNQDDLVLGLVMNNRLEETGGDKIFGLHLNILPIRMHIGIKYADNNALISALADERLRIEPHKIYPYTKLRLNLNTPTGFYTCAFNYTHFYISEEQTKNKLIQPLYAFEKMSIPFTLHVSRYQNSFRLIIRTSYQFTDKDTANNILKCIHDAL